MFKEKVVIKQIPDEFAEFIGMGKYKRSKMPQTVDILQVAQGPDSRYITGIDELAYAISILDDSSERERLEKEAKSLREKLEKAVGRDLSGTSKYWEEYSVKLSADQDLVLNRSNPQHVIAYHALVSNCYVAPSLEEAGLPRYKDAKYYAFSEEVENKKEVSTQKKRDKARAKLLEISDNKDYMVLLGEFLEGKKYTIKQDEDTLYSMLSDFINSKKETKNIDKFLKAAYKPVDELQFKIVIDRALRAGIIKINNNHFQRGQVTLGRTIEDVYDNLKSPKFATEFLSIKEELEL